MDIPEIKSRLPLSQVLSHYHLKPDRNNMLSCPFHADKTPSMQVYPETGTVHCFSSNCARSGQAMDVIDLVMYLEGLSKHEAILKAGNMAASPPPEDQGAGSNSQGSKTRDQGSAKQEPLPRAAILAQYQHAVQSALSRSPKAKAYAESRGLACQGIGYSGYKVGEKWEPKLKAQAEAMGLLKLKNCLIFGLQDPAGQWIGVYGRSIADHPKVRHFYPKGEIEGLYPGYPDPETQTLILTESVIDAATLQGSRNRDQGSWGSLFPDPCSVIALYGTNGLKSQHIELLQSLEELGEVILFFDGDEAGEKAVAKHSQTIQGLRPDLKISRVATPAGEDVNSLLVQQGPDTLRELIVARQALFLSNEKKKAEPKAAARLDTANPDLLLYPTDLLQIEVLGGIKLGGLDRLKATLKLQPQSYTHQLPLRQSLDLYHSRAVDALAEDVSQLFGLSYQAVQRSLGELTGALEAYRNAQLAAMKPKQEAAPELTEEQRQAAIHYLQSPKLLRRTLQDLAASGIVGESSNALIGWLSYTSRLREKPLHVMYLGASGSGKTHLQEKLGELIPADQKIEITSLSDNALYYFGREALKHKLILIEDLDGAENALYPLRELQSKQRIAKTVTLKNRQGRLETISLRVEGPVCVSGCTTRERLYEDNANRCLLLYIDQSSTQDARIMAYQQAMSSGAIDRGKEQQVQSQLRQLQQVLRPLAVQNPYAQLISLPKEVFKPRRTLLLLLSFIETITFYHQYQREVKTHAETGLRYIETTPEDIEAAFGLMKPVLFSKSDELSQATRGFFERLKQQVKTGEPFSSGEIRQAMRLSPSTLKRHLLELQKRGYLRVQGGSRYRGFVYQVVDYEEYEALKSGIDAQLGAILQKVKESSPVVQQWPSAQNGPLKAQAISELNGVAQ